MTLPQYLVQLRPARVQRLSAGPTPREADILAQHVDDLERLAASGTVLRAGRATTGDERAFGIVVFEAPATRPAAGS